MTAEKTSKLYNTIVGFVPRGATVIDVGAGMAAYHPHLLAKTRQLVLLDAYQPYLDKGPLLAHAVCGDAHELLPAFADGQFDVALGIDFVEHLELGRAFKVIEDMQRIANTVALFVPEGSHPQSADLYGMGGDHWQTHRSSWSAGDLEHFGFTVERWPDFHASSPGKDPGALWCTWRRLEGSGPVP